jgi:hypothetical protein
MTETEEQSGKQEYEGNLRRGMNIIRAFWA